MRRLLLFELNEFNAALLEEAARVLPAPNLRRMLDLNRVETTTDDVYDDGSLEPWVQWVSVHTGVPYAQHGILHIGDVPPEGQPQIWERLSDAGISSGIWGVLNGARRGAEHCRFFVPDPWTFTEDAHPSELQGLIALPRFLAKNRLSVFQRDLVPLAAQLGRAFARPRHLGSAGIQTARLLRRARHDPDKAYVYFSAFEYLSVKRFAEYKRRYDPALSVLFVNMLAHAQHYYWSPTDLRDNPRMQYVLRYVDRVAGQVLDARRPDEALVVMNGFEQFNISDRPKTVIYRQRDHHGFLAHLGLRATRVEAHMTNDAHFFFDGPEPTREAAEVLERVTVRGAPLFEVERYPGEDKLFVRVCYREPLDDDAVFEARDTTHRFSEWFDGLGVHTGRHGPRGTLLTTLQPPDGPLPNHQVFDWLLDYFDCGAPAGSLARSS